MQRALLIQYSHCTRKPPDTVNDPKEKTEGFGHGCKNKLCFFFTRRKNLIKCHLQIFSYTSCREPFAFNTCCVFIYLMWIKLQKKILISREMPPLNYPLPLTLHITAAWEVHTGESSTNATHCLDFSKCHINTEESQISLAGIFSKDLFTQKLCKLIPLEE